MGGLLNKVFLVDLLQSGGRTDLLKQAVSDARREGHIGDAEPIGFGAGSRNT